MTSSQEKFLSSEWILKSKHNISPASVLMVDANLIPPALEAACQGMYNISIYSFFLVCVYVIEVVCELNSTPNLPSPPSSFYFLFFFFFLFPFPMNPFAFLLSGSKI